MNRHAAHGGRPFWKSVFVSTTHCAAGCVIGDIIGASIVFRAGWTLFGERLYAEFLVLFILAYIFGIAFQYIPIRAMRRISRRVALLEAIKADTLALTAFEIGLFAWMAVLYFQFVPRPEPTSPTYWFMMQIGMVLGFIASFPANWYLAYIIQPGALRFEKIRVERYAAVNYCLPDTLLHRQWLTSVGTCTCLWVDWERLADWGRHAPPVR